jgi:hypothetical protein
MNVRRLIALAAAAVIVAAGSIALMPGQAQAYGSWQHASATKPIVVNYWHHRHHRHHRHHGPVIVL